MSAWINRFILRFNNRLVKNYPQMLPLATLLRNEQHQVDNIAKYLQRLSIKKLTSTYLRSYHLCVLQCYCYFLRA